MVIVIIIIIAIIIIKIIIIRIIQCRRQGSEHFSARIGNNIE